MLMSATAWADNWYVVGDNNGWTLSSAPEMTMVDNNIYVAKDLNFTGNGEFKITSTRDNWNNCRGGEGSFSIASANTLKGNNEGGNIKVGTGTFNIIADFNDNKVTAINASNIPSTLYIIGTPALVNNDWSPNNGIELTKEGDIFKAENVEFPSSGDGNSYFSFTSKLDPDWGNISAYRYGAVSGNKVVSETASSTFYKGENAFKIASGYYDVIVDFSTLNVKFVKKEAPAPVPAKYGINGQIFTEGEGWNVVDFTEVDGKWVIEKKDSYVGNFGISAMDKNGKQLTDPYGWIIPTVTPADAVTEGENGNLKLAKAGKYTYTFDPEKKTLTIEEFIPTYEYFIHTNIVKGGENWEDLAMTLSKDGKYEVAAADYVAGQLKILVKGSDNSEVYYGAADNMQDVVMDVAMQGAAGTDGSDWKLLKEGNYAFSWDPEKKQLTVTGKEDAPVLYMVGNFQATEFDIANPVELKEADGVYTYTFPENKAIDFKLSWAKPEGEADADKWNAFNTQLVWIKGNADASIDLAKGEYEIETVNNSSKGNLNLSAGSWVLTLDRAKNTMTLENNSLLPVTVEPAQDFVYFDNNTKKWEEVYVHYWGHKNTTWPGDKMTIHESKEGIWYAIVPKGTTGMVFNNGKDDSNGKEQTGDIKDDNFAVEYVFDHECKKGEHIPTTAVTPSISENDDNVVISTTTGLTIYYKIEKTTTKAPAKAAANTEGWIEAGSKVTIAKSDIADNLENGKLTYKAVNNDGEESEPAEFNINNGKIVEQLPTGVNDIAADGVEAEAVYYNLQGVRVANPAAGNLYIKVQGSKVSKVLVK